MNLPILNPPISPLSPISSIKSWTPPQLSQLWESPLLPLYEVGREGRGVGGPHYVNIL